MKKTLYLSLFLLAIGNNSQGQILLAADLNPGSQPSYPCTFTAFNGYLYLLADYHGTYGNELFKYDGINPATLVYDLNIGELNGVSASQFSKPYPIVNDTLYFIGQTDLTGFELMKIGNTGAPMLAGPQLIAGAGTALPFELITLENKIYFSATKPTTGREIYVHDPATNTTTIAADIILGTESGNPSDLCAYQGKLYFGANTVSLGYELQSYNPTTNTHSIVGSVNVGPGSSYPQQLTAIGDKLYFIATNSTYGFELYRFNGTTISRCTDANPGSGNGVAYFSPLYKGEIYFTGNDATGGSSKLFAYNPATNITTLKYEMDPSITSNIPSTFTIYGGKLYFFATTAAAGAELWVTDGTTTNMVQDLYPGTNGSFATANMTVWKGKLYFTANSSATSVELFVLSTTEGSSIRNVAFNGSATIGPNPTRDNATLLLDLQEAQSLAISVTDIMGRELFHSSITPYPNGKHEIILPIAFYSAGTYFYKIKNENGGTMLSGKLTKL